MPVTLRGCKGLRRGTVLNQFALNTSPLPSLFLFFQKLPESQG